MYMYIIYMYVQCICVVLAVSELHTLKHVEMHYMYIHAHACSPSFLIARTCTFIHVCSSFPSHNMQLPTTCVNNIIYTCTSYM